MKKFFDYFFIVLVAGLMLTACKKTTDAPEPEPEPEEPEQYADYILKMDVEYYYDFGYTGITVDYADFVTEDKEHIWDLFGYKDEAEFIAALGTLTDGLNDGAVKFVAFDASTEYIYETGCNTNGWGHWFSDQGVVTAWADGPYFFTEGYFPDTEDLTATLGSHPDQVTADLDGKEYRIIEGFTDEDITVACEFHITVTTEAPKVELNFVDSCIGSVELPLDYDYNMYELPGLDKNIAAQALGLENLEEANAYGVYKDGSYTVSPSGDIWYLMDGNPGNWGGSNSIGINKNNEDFGWGFCMYPADTLVGGLYTATIAFVNANNDAYKYTMDITVTEPKYVSTVDTLIYIDSLMTFKTYQYDSTYTHFDINIDSAKLVDAIGVSLEDAVACGVNPDGSITHEYGTNFWYMADGTIGSWSDGPVVCLNNETGKWRLCMYPNREIIGNTYTISIAFLNKDGFLDGAEGYVYNAYKYTLKVKIKEGEEQ